MEILSATRRLRGDLVFDLAGRRYGSMLYTGNSDESVHRFRGHVVVDFDDPRFNEQEIRVLNSSNVQAYVVTADWAGRRYSELGVTKPHYVIPHGVNLRALTHANVRQVAERYRKSDNFVVGYMASALRSRGDRDGANPMYNVDHLLDLWEEIHARVPTSVLWLLGGPSRRIIHRCEGREDILLFGSIPKREILAYVANFDVALYARTQDQGVRAAKVAEYLGAGVPTVSYDYRVTEILKEYGAGVLVRTPAEFVAAVENLSQDEPRLHALQGAARSAGQELDWDRLVVRYQRDVLDEYLP
jgi:glycosyltransferase involved in cell wall biosynthesis